MKLYKKYKKISGVALISLLFVMGLFISGCSDHDGDDVAAANPNNPALSLKGSIQGVVISLATGLPLSGMEAILTYDLDDDGEADKVIITTDGGGLYNFQNVPVSGSANLGGVAYTIVIEDPSGTYVTTWVAAALTYSELEEAGVLTTIGGEPQAVGDLMVQAGMANLMRPNVTVIGNVQDLLTDDPIEGASIVLSENGAVPTHSIPTTTAATNAAGEFTITNVPEGNNYDLTIAATGYGTITVLVAVATPIGPTTVYADATANDGIVATAYQLQPGAPTPDTTVPYATATNIPRAGVIPTSISSGPFTVTWSEPMDMTVGTVNIDTTGFRAPIPLSTGWDTAGEVLTITLTQAIPVGMNVQFAFAGFTDVTGNAHTGLRPAITSNVSPGANAADVISTWTDADGDARYDAGELVIGFQTASQGDSTLITVANLVQVTTPDDAAIDQGGPAANDPQANNLNVLDQFNALGVGTLGDAAGEADAISLQWDAATGARQYRIYAELNTGGFTNGLPVEVAGTPLSGSPDNTVQVSLADNDGVNNTGFVDGLGAVNTGVGAADNDVDGIEDAIRRFETVNAQNLPNVSDANMNGTVLFFDNGFNTIQMGATAFNSETIEGGFSNVISVGDVTAPVVGDQADYVAGAGGFGFHATIFSPLYSLTDGTSGGGTAATTTFNTIAADANGLDAVTGSVATNDGAYDADDWTAFSKQATLGISMNEDLDTSQTLSPTLTTSGSATLSSSALAGTGNARRTINVVISDATVLATLDTIDFAGVTDEAGNPAPSDFTAELLCNDLMGPFVTSAVTTAGTASSDTLTIGFHEGVDETTAETAANYVIGGVALTAISAVPTLTLDTSTNIVTITSQNNGEFVGLVSGTTVGTAVQDLAGNTFNGLNFLLDDQIPATVTAAGDGVGAGAINDGAPVPPANDGAWEVGDTGFNETYQVTLTFSENVFQDLNANGFLDEAQAQVTVVTASPAATYMVDSIMANVVTAATTNTATITFILRNTAAVETVAAADSLAVTYTDAGGLSGTATITLGAAGAGITINN